MASNSHMGCSCRSRWLPATWIWPATSFYCLLLLAGSSGGQQLPVPVFGSIQLQGYQSYESCSFLSYDVPESVAEMMLGFALLAPARCPARRAVVYLRARGYPVFSHLNETFPPHFYYDQGQAPVVIDPSTDDYEDSYITVVAPEHGRWYAAAFLDGEPGGVHADPECPYILWASQRLRGRAGIVDIGGLPQHIHLKANASVILRVHIPEHAYRLDVHAAGHVALPRFVNSSGSLPHVNTVPPPCHFSLLTHESGLLPGPGVDDRQTRSVFCNTSSDNCSLTVYGPPVASWHHLVLQNHVNADCIVILEARSFACQSQSHSETNCVVHQLRRTISSDTLSSSDFYPSGMHLSVSTTPSFAAFHLLPSGDGGGTLHIAASLSVNTELGAATSSVFQHSGSISLCVKQGAIPVATVAAADHQSATAGSGLLLSCSGPHAYALAIGANLSTGTVDAYIPYPRGGWWYIGFVVTGLSPFTSVDRATITSTTSPSQGRFDSDNTTLDETSTAWKDSKATLVPELQANDSFILMLRVRTGPCVDGDCGSHGACSHYIKGPSALYLTSCSCTAGWRGYGCTDGSRGLSGDQQLVHKLLLTLSNVGFLAAACLAIRWRWFSEAVVYIFTALSSALYHLCDGSNMFNRCVLPFKHLQIMDFVGSSLSLWVTLLSLAKIHPVARAALQMTGVLTLLGLTMNSATSLWNIVAPVTVGGLIFIASAVVERKARGRCYPQRRVWLVQILPGSLFAVTALVLFALKTTSVDSWHSYAYTHTAWHVVAAVAIMCILPRQQSIRCSASAVAALLRRVFKARRGRLDAARKRADCSENGHALEELH